MGKVQEGIRLGYEKARDMGRRQLHLCLENDRSDKKKKTWRWRILLGWLQTDLYSSRDFGRQLLSKAPRNRPPGWKWSNLKFIFPGWIESPICILLFNPFNKPINELLFQPYRWRNLGSEILYKFLAQVDSISIIT